MRTAPLPLRFFRCALALPLNNFTAGIGSFVTFSEIVFNLRVTPEVMAAGMGFALVVGTPGGFFPARAATRKEILTAIGRRRAP